MLSIPRLALPAGEARAAEREDWRAVSSGAPADVAPPTAADDWRSLAMMRARDPGTRAAAAHAYGEYRDALDIVSSDANDPKRTANRGFAGAASAAQLVSELALDPEGAKTASAVLGPLFALSTILFIVRIVMTWYPSVPYTKLPWVLAYAPTEPLLKPTRALVPPVGGVDVSPIIWVGMISFMNEILLGKQGLLVLLANKQLGG